MEFQSNEWIIYIYDASDWKNLTIEIYDSINDAMKKNLICKLKHYRGINSSLYNQYIINCISEMIRKEIDDIFENKRDQKIFVNIFGTILTEEKMNALYADLLIDKLISYNRFNALEIINLLSDKNCTYVFSYIVIYYSIYKFRINWEYVNVDILKALWKKNSSVENELEEVLKRLIRSNISHRFEEKMLFKLFEYTKADLTCDLFNTIKADNVLDLFYVVIIVACVCEQENRTCLGKIEEDIQIEFINHLSKHSELIENKNIQKLIWNMRYTFFEKLNTVPRNLNMSLKNLLLTNINYQAVINFVNEEKYMSLNGIGEYLLIHTPQFPTNSQQQTIIDDIIKNAFIASNMPIDSFMEKLQKECSSCGCEITYINREMMKEYLLKIFQRRSTYY